jgi:dihydroflavonol-4-reductase
MRPPRTEDFFCTTYEEAKYRAELAVQEYAQQGLPVVIVNPGGVYGPGGVTATGQPIVDALNGKLPMTIPGVVNFVYVDNVVRRHLLAAEKDG